MARKSQSVDDFEKNIKKEFEFKCCKTKESAVKICIKCKKFYHNSCLARNKKIKIFSFTEIVCCDITSPEDKKYNDMMTNYKNLQTYCAGIEKQLKAITAENQSLKSLQKKGDNIEQPADSENVSLLKRLVEEMTDKNQLLVEKNNFLRHSLNSSNAKNCGQQSYAQVASRLFKTTAPLIINLKDKEDIEATKRIKDIVTEEKSALELVSGKNGKIVIRGSRNEDLVSIKRRIEDEMEAKAEAVMGKLRNPRVKVVGIARDFETSELLEDIIVRNGFEDSTGIEIVHTYKRNDRTTAILEVTPKAYQQIMDRSKLFIGWQKCPVYDDLNVGICYKCCGYNHTSKKCTKKEVCAKCTGEH